MAEVEGSLSIALFSGTDDRLTAAATLAAGAAAMGRSVDVLVQFWALDAFRAEAITKDHGVSAEAGPEGSEAMRRHADRGAPHWSETLRQVKELGTLRIHACAHSIEMLELTAEDLDPLIDGIEGIASFMSRADGPVVFI